jgi:hypothetical protein
MTAGAATARNASQAPAVPAASDPSSSGTTTANVNVGLVIALTGLTPSFTLSGLPGDVPTDFGAVTMNVLANNVTGYNVTVQGAVPNLTDTGGDIIPVSDLLVNDGYSGGTTGFIPVSAATPVQVFNHGTPSGTTGDTVTNDYRIAIPSVPNGLYSGTLNYVASTNP